MKIDGMERLSKSIKGKVNNRAIKIAYIVPDELAETHQILDAVFYDSYQR